MILMQKTFEHSISSTGFKVGDSNDFAIRLPTFSVSYVLDGVVISYLMEGYYYPDQLICNAKLPQKIKTYVS